MSNTTIVDVGTPPVDVCRLGVHGDAEVYFHNPVDMPKGSFVESPPFFCFGNHLWKLRLYPRGSSQRRDNKKSFGLVCCSSLKLSFTVELSLLENVPRKRFVSLGYKEWQRSHVTNAGIEDDELNVLEFDAGFFDSSSPLIVKIVMTSGCSLYAQPNSDGGMFALIGDRETSDVAFQTKDDVLYAHTVILKAYAPSLYDLCETYDEDNPMPVNDVDSRIFRAMLGTLYGNTMAAYDWDSDLKVILKTADKYGFPQHLKIAVEKWYVEATELTVDNVIDELLYADGSGHALMKQTAFRFIKKNVAGVLSSEAFGRLYESERLVKEVMVELGDEERQGGDY